MPVNPVPSEKPSAPRKPPAAPAGTGASGQAGVDYGARKNIKVHGGGSERASDFSGSNGKPGGKY